MNLQILDPIWKLFRFGLKAILTTLLLIIVLAVISAFYNLTLPERSEITEHLTTAEKAQTRYFGTD
jgi:Na+/melibiose symporter-like transporter